MVRPTYLAEAYRDRIATRVVASGPEGLVCEDTVFHPAGGGQPGDSGRARLDGTERRIETSEEFEGGVRHRWAPEGAGEVPAGTPVELEIDWERRYRFMRYHTALHVLSGVVYARFGSGITGNQIAEDRARMDFSLPDFSRPLAEELIAATNAVAARGHPVEVRFATAAELAARPDWVRVAEGKIAVGNEVRLIDIVGFDVQADGGTHVRSTSEVGTISLDRIENKGARNKRLYLQLDSRPAPALS